MENTATIPSAPSTTTAVAAVITTPTPYPTNMESGYTEFYQNPDMGTDCASGVWLDYYYCIANNDQASSSATVGSTSHTITIRPGATYTEITPQSKIPPIKVKSEKTDKTESEDTGDNDNTGDNDDTGDDDDNTDDTDNTSSMHGEFLTHLSYLVEGGGGGTTEDIPKVSEDEDCTSMVTATICTVLVQIISTSRMTSATVSSSTYCGPTEGCSATPSTTTSTITTTGTYLTETNSFMYVSEPVEDSSLLASIASGIVSRRNAMDATRWGSATATGSSTSSSSTGTSSTSISSTSISSTSTSSASTDDQSISTSSSSSSSATIEANTPPTSDYYELNMYSDSTCGSYLTDDEGSTSDVGCIAWVTSGGSAVYPLFDESVFSIAAYSGDSCDSSDKLMSFNSGTCYELDIESGKGSWKITKL
ncbi:glycoside hydrolase [Penicillium odoratum]|uniref:glycoside hydrolase n=1 Tax=Penicillium odoratum TaxID=1167516 RepID=UPI002548C683|nr:glycoside hydrolase [Penicillium odoratum]KAJ5751641.1 glycoside hydrolase [Penicillium odoratum]